MKSNFLYFYLTILTALKGNDFKSTGTKDICGLKEVLVIIKTNSDLLLQQVDSAATNIQQNCADAKNKIDLFRESETISKIFLVMESMLTSLENPDGCNKQVLERFNVLQRSANLQFEQCNAQSKANEIFLTNKTETTNKWKHAVKIMTGLVLQKCAMKTLYNGCSALKSCCLDGVGEMTSKIIEAAKNSTQDIQAIVDSQDQCFNSITKEALDIQKSIQEEMFQCSFRDMESLVPEGSNEIQSSHVEEKGFQNKTMEVSTQNSIASKDVSQSIDGSGESQLEIHQTTVPGEAVEVNPPAISIPIE